MCRSYSTPGVENTAWDIYPTRPYFTNLDSHNISRISFNGSSQYVEFITAGNEYWFRFALDVSQLGNFTHGFLKNYFNGHTSNNPQFPHPPLAGIDAHYFVQEGNTVYESIISDNRYWARTGTDFNNMGTYWWTDDFNSFSPATTYDDQCQPTSFIVPFNRVCRRPVYDTLKNFDFKSYVPTPIPGDVDGNRQVNGLDVIMLISYLDSPTGCSRCDIDGSGQVNGLDIIMLIGYL